MTHTRHWPRLLLLLILSAATFLLFIGRRDIVTSHEARVAQTARQMAEAGWPWQAERVEVPTPQLVDLPEGKRLRAVDEGPTMSVNPWVVPVLNGQIRLQKPPLPYWCSAVLFRVVGFGEGVSRFTPALLGAVSVLLMWDLARMLIGRVGAWYAALVWVSSYFIVDEFRKTMADPYLAFFTLLATWAWMRRCVTMFWASLALGMLAKGPVILVFVATYLILYRLLYRRRVSTSWSGHLVGIILFVAIALPWYLIVWRSIPNALELWRYESVGELSDNAEKSRQWWYYLANLLMISLPWTPLWLMGLVYPFAFRLRRRRLFGTAATVAVVLFFSLVQEKKNAYLLPLMPIQTLLVAQALLWLTVIVRVAPRNRPVRVPLMRVAALSLVFAIGVQVLVSGVLAQMDNNRSPKDACRVVTSILNESPQTSVLVSRLPEEVSMYLPLGLRDAKTSQQVLLIADDRKGQADAVARSVTATLSGPVASIEQVPIPHSRTPRWKVFNLKIGPQVPQPAGPTTSGAPATDPG